MPRQNLKLLNHKAESLECRPQARLLPSILQSLPEDQKNLENYKLHSASNMYIHILQTHTRMLHAESCLVAMHIPFPPSKDLLFRKSIPFVKCIHLNIDSFQKGFEAACEHIHMAAEKRIQEGGDGETWGGKEMKVKGEVCTQNVS